MKSVLITGENSYIGTSFEQWVEKNCYEIQIDTQDMRGDAWKERNFNEYDTVFHVAGIAHADVGKVSEEQKELYYKVNTELTVACAKKAKAEGIKQFIFMSSIIVYGESAGIGREKVITRETPLAPANFYGDSKVRAEAELQKLNTENFKVVILRPPMIYGKGSKGNYPLLAKLACKLPFFPDIQNERSMLYIGNLCKFISLVILNEESGVFFPQNDEYVRTSDMVKQIGMVHHKKVHLIKFLNPFLSLLGNTKGKQGELVNKAFGSFVYDRALSSYKQRYNIYDFQSSIELTEKA